MRGKGQQRRRRDHQGREKEGQAFHDRNISKLFKIRRTNSAPAAVEPLVTWFSRSDRTEERSTIKCNALRGR
jgi:hypothetical protein